MGNVCCKFTFLFFAVLGVYMLLDTAGLGIPVLFAVAAHECGHLAMLYRCGGRLARIEFAPYGIRMEKRGMLSYAGESAVYFGGVLANALCVLGCLLFLQWGNFARVSLLLAVFHLLPIGRLDGGVLLRLALCRAGLGEKASAISTGLALVLLLPLFCAALYMARSGNYSLLFTAIYLLSAQIFAGDGL